MENQKKLKPIYNPTWEDFTVTYDINGDKRPESFTIHAQEIAYFEPVIADHIKLHLGKKLVMTSGKTIMDWDKELAEAMKKVEVSLDGNTDS